jgi:hypothetical protein
MPKSFRHYKKSGKRKLKSRRTRRRNLKAGNGDKVKCCMCEKMVNNDDTFVPVRCLNQYGRSAHRICSKCWWDKKKGFAREDISHECPGCRKGLPLTHVKKEPTIYVDLTED